MAKEEPKLLNEAVIYNLGDDSYAYDAVKKFLKEKYDIEIPGDKPLIEVLIRTGCNKNCPTQPSAKS